MKQAIQNALSRRKALAGAGVAGAAAAAAALLPAGVPTAPQAAAAPRAAARADEAGYQVTEHVQRYYDTART